MADAQNPLTDIILDRLYTGSLDNVLKEISDEFHVSFEYKTELLSKIDITERPMKKPLGEFLTGICDDNKLKYYLDAKKVIHVISRYESVNGVAVNAESNAKSTEGAHDFNFTLSGIIKDIETGEALPYATIAVKGTTNGTYTNANGFFTLSNVPTDTSELEIRFIGYKTSTIKLSPKLPKSGLIFEIKSSYEQLEEVTVKGEREDIMQLKGNDGLSLIKMSPKQLNQLPNIGEKDMMRSLQLMPGIAASNESSSGLYVRGGTPDQNLIIYDGFTVYQVDHLYGFFSAFNSNAIKDIQLYKGGFESRFGGRLSSVTEITGKDGDDKKFNMGGDLSLLSGNAFIEFPIGSKVTFLFDARKSYRGPLYNLIFNKFNTDNSQTTAVPRGGPNGGADFVTKATSYFYDLNSKLTFKPTKKDAISLSLFNGTDKLDNGFDNSGSGFGPPGGTLSISNTDITKYGNTGLSLKWYKKWNEKLFGSALVSYSNYFSNRDRTNSLSITDTNGDQTTNKFGVLENNDLKDYSFKIDYTYDIAKSHQLGFGSFGTLYNTKYTYSQNDTSTILDKNEKGIVAGLYFQDKIKLMENKLLITPGMRETFFDITQKVYTEPRLNISYNFTKKLTLHLATGKFYQFTNRIVREDILAGSKDFWLLSNNTNIPVSSAIHYIAGLSYETKNYLFSAEAYYKTLNGISEYSLRFNPSPTGINYEENFYTGTGYSRGIEFLIQKKFGKFSGWISYTLSETKNHFEVYSKNDYPANQDVPNEFKVVALYKWKQWNFSATWIYATGKPYTAPSGAYSVTLLDGTTQDYFTTTSKNSLRLPDYHRLDFAINYTFRSGGGNYNLTSEEVPRKEIGSIGFSLFNVYDRSNVWYKQYDIVSGQIIETNVNYLGITPNLTLTLKLH